ncbi:MAG: TlpA disulfide reductase family protein [Candidatus Aminicenantaceae bacterium]
MKKDLLFLFVFIIILLFATEMCKDSSPTEPEPEPTPEQGTNIGNQAVNFTAKDQGGSNVSLYDYSGKVVLVNMSADWCGPCRNEATHLEALYDEYKQQGFQIITVLISGDPAVWGHDYQLTFPVLDDNSEAIWDQYGEGSVPLNLVIDREKVIRYKEAGYDEAAIKAVIEKYL